MKAEINNENKAKFFALYWGQKVLEYPKDNLAGRSGGISLVGWMISTDVCVTGFLHLKPLSRVSDEDSLICGYDTREQAVRLLKWNVLSLPTWETDYLRSKGYAIPWMGLSVEEMIEAGWIKLTKS